MYLRTLDFALYRQVESLVSIYIVTLATPPSLVRLLKVYSKVELP